MKKFSLIFISLFILPVIVNANTISNIDMDIFIDDNGNANVTEVWTATLDSGTEEYHPYYNLGESYISDINVTMDDKPFIILDDWNISNSFYNKKYKAGLYNAGDGEYDICFGISEYGTHQYIINYKINNFIIKLNDADMLYWNLFPKKFMPSPREIDITIYGDNNYSDIGVWGYGKDGIMAYVSDGKIHVKTEDIKSSQYLTLLVKYPSETFNTNYIDDRSFDYYLDMANEDATIYKDDSVFPNIIWILFVVLFICLFSFIFDLVANKISNNQYSKKNRDVVNKVKNVSYYRELIGNDIFYIYWLSLNFNLIRKKSDIFVAFILKWIKEGNVKIEKRNKKMLFFSKNDNVMIFVKSPKGVEWEKNLYKWFKEASKDGCLDYKEFHKWCCKHNKLVVEFMDKVIEYEKDKLIKQKRAELICDKHGNQKVNLSDDVLEDAKKLVGLKKYLKNFYNVRKKDIFDVKLLNDYLIYAQIFGVSELFIKYFRKGNPNINNVLIDSSIFFERIDNSLNKAILYYSIGSLFGYRKNTNDNLSSDYDLFEDN